MSEEDPKTSYSDYNFIAPTSLLPQTKPTSLKPAENDLIMNTYIYLLRLTDFLKIRLFALLASVT